MVEEHDLWLERHNTQRHQAHEKREDGRRSPSEVLGLVRVVRHHPVDLGRAFFSTMLVRKLDAAGYARVRHWRVYAARSRRRPEALQQALFPTTRPEGDFFVGLFSELRP